MPNDVTLFFSKQTLPAIGRELGSRSYPDAPATVTGWVFVQLIVYSPYVNRTWSLIAFTIFLQVSSFRATLPEDKLTERMNGVPDDGGILKIPINFVLCSSISTAQKYTVTYCNVGCIWYSVQFFKGTPSSHFLPCLSDDGCKHIRYTFEYTHMLRPSLDHQDESADLRATKFMYFFVDVSGQQWSNENRY